MPRPSTIAPVCEHAFWVAYHAPLRLKIASWASPYLTAVPLSGGMSAARASRTHDALAAVAAFSGLLGWITGSRIGGPGFDGPPWPRSSTLVTVASPPASLAKWRNWARLAGSSTTPRHSHA